MTNELTIQSAQAIMPVMDIMTAMQRRQAIIDFTKQVMKDGVDFGKIPGTDKDTLLKPGAEKLTSLFGLSPHFEIREKELDWTGENHGGEPFFYFQYCCSLYRGDLLVGQGVGSCNSWEKKYRYRTAELKCPDCEQETIKKSKFPPRNNPQAAPGWYCYAKAGGCGAEFGANDPRIVDQPRGQVANPNPADLVNTIDKMAQKRGLVASTLIAINASEFFTQDVEDMDFGVVVDAPYVEVKPEPAPRKAQPAQVAQQKWKEPKPVDISDSDLTTDGEFASQKNARSTQGDRIFPANLADFAKEFAEQHEYYDNNIHVVNTLKQEIDANIGVNFKNYAESELISALELHAAKG